MSTLDGFGLVMLLHRSVGVERGRRHGETGDPQPDYVDVRLGTGLA